jgi:hypothetical protein
MTTLRSKPSPENKTTDTNEEDLTKKNSRRLKVIPIFFIWFQYVTAIIYTFELISI